MLMERKHLLSLASEDALDAVLDSPHAPALVQSFPEEDLHLLIHEIGVEDALPLLSMASDEQWSYMLDMEAWEGDQMASAPSTNWLSHLIDADPERLTGRFFDEHLEDMELYLFKNVQVALAGQHLDPGRSSSGWFTFDEQFYFRFIDNPTDSGPQPYLYDRERILMQFLQQLAEHDYSRYLEILLEASQIMPSETEEEMYRLRNVRLAEKGFLPFEEAIGIYQPLRPGDMERLGETSAPVPTVASSSSSLIPLAQATRTGGVFGDATGLIESEESMLRIQREIADLSNRIVSADRLRIRERSQLDAVVQKATAYIGIGLESLSSVGGQVDLNRAAALVERFPLVILFRYGYGLALKLKIRAREWQGRSWPVTRGIPDSFWGEQFRGILDGLLMERPLFHDHDSGASHRGFSTLEDIRATENAMDDIAAVDKLLNLMSMPALPVVLREVLSYKNLLLTLWARHHIGLPVTLSPIALEEFRSLFQDLWAARGPSPMVKASMKASFLDWLSRATGLIHHTITQELGGVLDSLFEDIQDELGHAEDRHLDPRYIELFLLKA